MVGGEDEAVAEVCWPGGAESQEDETPGKVVLEIEGVEGFEVGEGGPGRRQTGVRGEEEDVAGRGWLVGELEVECAV